MDKETKKLVRALGEQGFTTRRTKNSHWLVCAPGGRLVTTLSGTMSDRKSLLNAQSVLRKAGYQPGRD